MISTVLLVVRLKPVQENLWAMVWGGVSGRLYGKEFVLDCLVKRSQALCEVEAKGFKLYPD